TTRPPRSARTTRSSSRSRNRSASSRRVRCAGTSTPTSTGAWPTTTTSASRRPSPKRRRARAVNPPGVRLTNQAIRRQAGWLFYFHAKNTALRRPGQHLGRPDFLVLHHPAHGARVVGSVFPLRAGQSARMGVRRDDHALRHALHDGRGLHAVEERPRARRRVVWILPAAHAGHDRPHAVHRLL